MIKLEDVLFDLNQPPKSEKFDWNKWFSGSLNYHVVDRPAPEVSKEMLRIINEVINNQFNRKP